LKGLGPAIEERLTEAGIPSPAALLRRLPRRYEDRSSVLAGGALDDGQLGWLRGRVERVNWGRPRGPRTRVSLHLDCDGQALVAHWFRGGRQVARRAPKGTPLVLWAGLSRSSEGVLQTVHPQWRTDDGAPLEGGIRPVYDLPTGVGERRWRSFLRQCLDGGLGLTGLTELTEVAGERRLPSLSESLELLHFPPPDADIDLLNEGGTPAHERMALEAISVQQLVFAGLRAAARHESALRCRSHGWASAVEAALPFRLTEAQRVAHARLADELASGRPLRTLLQGDVGSGKTVVAVLCAARVAEAGGQVALLSPTELIARQQARTIERWLAPHGIGCGGLWASQPRAERRGVEERVAAGEIQVLAGTQALFSESMEFRSLALVVVDEQHRFGIAQRARMAAKGRSPHVLAMTATPIPRSLALCLHGDLDLLTLDAGPVSRRVETVVLDAAQEAAVAERLRASSARAFVVCPRVQDRGDGIPSVEATARRWREWLGDARVAAVYGEQDRDQRTAALTAFEAGELSVLVASTVVEVGLDLRGVDEVIVLGAERFGLATLHQLRGRAGRGGQPARCVLVVGPGGDGRRIQLLRDLHDGLELAERDLDLRGPGEFLGTRQSGAAVGALRLALRHPHLLGPCRRWARELVAAGPPGERRHRALLAWARSAGIDPSV
jgi:ATP-dependent DNA helicase RecG